MKNVLITCLGLCFASAAIANSSGHLLCVNDQPNSKIIAVNYFNLHTDTPTVKLYLRSNAGKKGLLGECKRDTMAIEGGFECNVMTSTDSGYRIYLYSKGDSHHDTSVVPWSMQGEKQPVSVPCR